MSTERTYWLTTRKFDESNMVEVRYSTPSLGFTVTKEVTEEIANMLEIAKEAGAAKEREKIRRALGINSNFNKVSTL